MRDEVIDFCSAAAEMLTHMNRPKGSYGHASNILECLAKYDTLKIEITKRAKPLTRSEIDASLEWLSNFHKPTAELALVITRINKILEPR